MYYITKDNVIVLYDEDRKRLVGTLAFMPQYEGLEVLETNENETIVDGELLTLEEAEEINKQKEAERIALLKMTPRDFLLAITSMGVDWADIKTLMAQNPQVEIELNYCQFVYRGNPLLDELCGNFGVTSEQLDELFKVKGG